VLTKRIRETKQDPARDQNFDEMLQQMLRERAAMNEIVRSINERNVLNFFTDEGLLPNYAFPEAGVVLRSVIYRRNSKAEDDERKYTTIPMSMNVQPRGNSGTGAGEPFLCRRP